MKDKNFKIECQFSII